MAKMLPFARFLTQCRIQRFYSLPNGQCQLR